jgi:hypothetical protein
MLSGIVGISFGTPKYFGSIMLRTPGAPNTMPLDSQ